MYLLLLLFVYCVMFIIDQGIRRRAACVLRFQGLPNCIGMWSQEGVSLVAGDRLCRRVRGGASRRLAKWIGIADLAHRPNGIRMCVRHLGRLWLGEACRHLLVPLVATVPIVHCPRGEAISRYLCVFLMYLPDALHVVGDARVQKLVAGSVTALATALIVGAPKKIANLEETVIRTAIRIEATHRGSVVRRLVLGNAHPGGNLLHGQLVLIVQLLRQLTSTVDLSLSRGRIAHLLHMLYLGDILRLQVLLRLLLLVLVGAGAMMIPSQSTSCHIGCCVLATIRSIRLPCREAISGDALMLRIYLAHT